MFIHFFFAFNFKEMGSSCTQKNHKAQNKNIFELNLWNLTEASMRNFHTNMNRIRLRQHNHISTKNARGHCYSVSCSLQTFCVEIQAIPSLFNRALANTIWPRSFTCFLVVFFSGLFHVTGFKGLEFLSFRNMTY